MTIRDKEADFRKALGTATGEMSELIEERTNIDRRITQLKATIDTLSALLNEQTPYVSLPDWEATAGVLNELGISDAIRNVLLHAPAPMSPTEIKAALAEVGLPLDQYASAMSVIHNTLKRLEKQNELLTVKDSTGKVVAYTTRWKADNFRLDPLPVYVEPKSGKK